MPDAVLLSILAALLLVFASAVAYSLTQPGPCQPWS